MKLSPVVTSVLFVCLLAVYGLVGNLDAQDQVDSEAFYCEMVEAGSWPAYREDVSCDD